MKTTCILIILLIGGIQLSAQDSYDQKIQSSFEEFKKAYLNVDRAKLLEFVYPYTIQVSGGESYVIDDMTNDYNMYASAGLVIKDILLKQGSKVIEVGDELQAMFPYERHLMKATEELVESGFYLLVSSDKGQSWSFTDMKKHDAESIRIFVPSYNERFNIYLNSTHK